MMQHYWGAGCQAFTRLQLRNQWERQCDEVESVHDLLWLYGFCAVTGLGAKYSVAMVGFGL